MAGENDFSRNNISQSPVPTQIVGEDDSVPVVDNSMAPFNAICAIYGMNGDGTKRLFHGTGWLVTPFYVVTAAHVVTKKADGMRVPVSESSLRLYFESRIRLEASSFLSVEEISIYGPYLENSAVQNDIAILRIEQVDHSARDHLILHNTTDQIVGNEVMSAGYPDNKDHGFQMYSSLDIIERIDECVIRHKVDTYEGQSGSPLILSNGGYRVVGVHTKGFDSEALNRGCLIYGEVKIWLEQHIAGRA